MGLMDRIRQVASEHGDEPAFVFVNHRGEGAGPSWREFAFSVAATAERIERCAPRGAVLTVSGRNNLEGVTLVTAVLAAGRTVLPLDPRYPSSSRQHLEQEIRDQGGDVEDAQVLLGSEGPAKTTGAHRGTGPFASGGHIVATGGSTGSPKSVYTPNSPYYAPRNVPSALLRRTGWRNHQTQLLAGPLYHSASFARLVDGLLSGNTIVVPQVFRADVILDVVERYGVEWMQLTPSHMQALDEALRSRPEAMLSVRGVLHTAAPCPSDTKRNWIEQLGGDRVFEMYTATEGIGATLCNGHEWLERPGTVGRGFFTRIRVLDDNRSPLPAGRVGGVYMRGIPRARRLGDEGSPEGYASVGDRGHLDEDGYLYLSGRREDMAIVGGENVYLSEVTSVVLACPGVADAAVTEVPDSMLGSRLRALVVRGQASNLTTSDLLEHCVSKLASYQVPSQVTFVGCLPRTDAGKLDRSALTRLVETS
jgi:bile acid-coenzyme A ligase